jgi:hypothetical protein
MMLVISLLLLAASFIRLFVLNVPRKVDALLNLMASFNAYFVCIAFGANIWAACFLVVFILQAWASITLIEEEIKSKNHE